MIAYKVTVTEELSQPEVTIEQLKIIDNTVLKVDHLYVTSLEYSNEKNILLTAEFYNKIHLLDTNTWQVLKTIDLPHTDLETHGWIDFAANTHIRNETDNLIKTVVTSYLGYVYFLDISLNNGTWKDTWTTFYESLNNPQDPYLAVYPTASRLTDNSRFLAVPVQSNLYLEIWIFDLTETKQSNVYKTDRYTKVADNLLTQHYD